MSAKHTTEKNTKHLGDAALENMMRVDDDYDPQMEIQAHQHLENCSLCRNRLESLAAEPWMWEGAGEVLDSAQELLDNNETNWASPDTATHSDPTELRIPPGLLEAPSHPEMLGRLGDHEIESAIGSGGMGMVFKGFDVELNRPVAIKVLAPRFSSVGVARKRFTREARAAAAICHENVVSIHRIDTTSPNPFIVMPFVGGGSLQDFVDKNGPPEAVEIVQIGKQIAAGLAAAHEVGVIHRDVKPGNILLENGCNRVLITDFGLALVESDVSLTRSGMIAGTPFYMSPEQARGQVTGAKSDLFALGGTLYFLATGRPPFAASNAMAVLNKICQESPPDVRSLNPTIPAALANVIHTLLEKNPDHRCKSARNVEMVLTEYLAHLQQPMVNKKPLIAVPFSTRKRKTRTRLSWVVGIMAVAVVAMAAWFSGPLLELLPAKRSTSPPPSNNNGMTGQFGQDPSFYLGMSDASLDSRLQDVETDLRRVESNLNIEGFNLNFRVDSEFEHIDAMVRELEKDDPFDMTKLSSTDFQKTPSQPFNAQSKPQAQTPKR